jgi:TetR/AcrR family hemagglutinin/protease transcriptional regulator
VPTVYAYFDTRDSLTRAVLELVDVRLTDIVWGAAKQRDGAFSKILEVTKAFSNSVGQEPDIMKIWLDWSTAFDDGAWPLYENLQKRVAALFCEIIRDGQKTGEVSLDINPEIAAYIVIAGGHMMVQMRLAQKAPVDIDAFLNKLVAGALKPHGTSSNEGLS